MCAYAVLQQINRACIFTRLRSITHFRARLSNAKALRISSYVNNEKFEDFTKEISNESKLCEQEETGMVQPGLQCNKIIDGVDSFNNKSRLEDVIDTVRIKNEEAAASIASIIIDDLKKNMSHVTEMNPGGGLLTEKLLQAGVPKIYAFEKNAVFIQKLRHLQQKYPGRLCIKKYNLLELPRLFVFNPKDGECKLKELFQDVKPSKWEEKCNIQIIGIIRRPQFMRHIILNIIFEEGIMAIGRPCFYFMIPSSLNELLGCLNDSTSTNSTRVLFQIFFDYKILGQLDTKLFVPSLRIKKKINKTTPRKDQRSMYCLKIEPKHEIYQEYIKGNNLIAFWYFVRHFTKKSKGRLIPEIEKIAPGCGVEMIKKNYNIFTEISDLSPKEMLDIFNDFQSWPGYTDTIFMPAVDMICMQLQKSAYAFKE